MQDHHHIIDITKTSTPSNTFRVNSIRSQYDYNNPDIVEKFKIEFTTPSQWNIGLIVGASGTGKTTIAKELFKGQLNSATTEHGASVIDDMPKNHTVDDITKLFNKLGFSSVPSWLKPYHVLSNGERMRVDLTATLLDDNPIKVFDEYTSVVDRTIAENMSLCLSKLIRSENQKFVAVSCHFDVIDWLQPDWIIDTNTMTFTLPKGSRSHHENSQSDGVSDQHGRILANIII